MKKLFVLSCVALATLASCSKSEDIEAPQAQKEIAFNVATDKSRAPIEGDEFPTTLSMYVSAYNSVSKDYFKNVAFSYHQRETKWKAGMYWPANGVTSFLAYAFTPETQNVMSSTTAVWGVGSQNQETKWAQQVAFDFAGNSLCYAPVETTSTTVSDPMTPYVDLLYANADQTKEGTYTNVSMKFKHTGAWVVFKVKLENSFTPSNTTLTVNSFELAKIYKSGKLTVDNSIVGGAKASWAFTGDAADYAVESFPQTKGLKITDSEQTFGAIIPEQNQTAIKFRYTLSGDNITDQVVDYEFPLNRFDKWEMGKKYVYNITITFEEIEIAPSVTDWGDPTDTAIGI